MQLEGNIMFGLGPSALVDYSDEVSSLVITSTINTTTRPPTFANAKPEQKKGSISDVAAVNFFQEESDAAGLWLLVWDAQRDDDTVTDGRDPGEIYFSATFKPGDADPDTNPQFEGWLLPTALNTGGTVSEWKQQNQSWPVRDLTKVADGS
jgi:hypothetical protein